MARLRLALVALATTLLLALVPGTAQASPPRLVGVNRPGLSTFTAAEVVRVFLPHGPQTFASSGQLRAVPAGKVLIVSFWDYPSDATFRQVLADWDRSGRRIWWAYHHEADLPNDPITPAQYRSRYAHLLALWQPYRGSNLMPMTILSGSVLTRGPDDWYVPGVLALGFDVYYLTNVPKVIAYANGKGKPLAIPEWGNGTNTVNTGATDAQDLAFAKAYMALLTPTVFAACWFSKLHNDLSHLPKTAAYLRSVT